MKLFIAKFTSGHYPEDNRILGVYSSWERATFACAEYIRTDKNIYPNHPLRYQQNRSYYDIVECELDEEIYCA